MQTVYFSMLKLHFTLSSAHPTERVWKASKLTHLSRSFTYSYEMYVCVCVCLDAVEISFIWWRMHCTLVRCLFKLKQPAENTDRCTKYQGKLQNYHKWKLKVQLSDKVSNSVYFNSSFLSKLTLTKPVSHKSDLINFTLNLLTCQCESLLCDTLKLLARLAVVTWWLNLTLTKF